MYTALKKFIKALLPSKVFSAVKPALRKVYGLLYIGNRVHCNICDQRFRKFILIENGRDLLCPSCGSIPRYRFLFMLLQEKYQLESLNRKVLHFSPSYSLKNRLRSYSNLDYTTTDFISDQEDKRYDITAIEANDSSYDLVICLHVLEHIPDDRKAMSELYRIIKPEGLVFIQTPFKSGEIYEDPSVQTEEERLKHFGQEDHVRIYSVAGLKERLNNAGFKIEQKDASAYPKNILAENGILEDDLILVCKK